MTSLAFSRSSGGMNKLFQQMNKIEAEITAGLKDEVGESSADASPPPRPARAASPPPPPSDRGVDESARLRQQIKKLEARLSEKVRASRRDCRRRGRTGEGGGAKGEKKEAVGEAEREGARLAEEEEDVGGSGARAPSIPLAAQPHMQPTVCRTGIVVSVATQRTGMRPCRWSCATIRTRRLQLCSLRVRR